MTPRITLIAIASLLASCSAVAQMPLSPSPPDPLGGSLPPPPVGALVPIAPVAPEAGTVATGRVQQWLLNPDGDADGLLLADGTQVAFPPHLSVAIMQLLKLGDTVRVDGWRAPSVPVVRMQSLSANGRTVIDQPPVPGMLPPPRAPGALGAMSAGGRIERLLYTDRGDVQGVMLADKTIVRFPPHIGAMYSTQLRPGAPLYARGWGTRGVLGASMEATSLGVSPETVRDVLGGPGF